MEQRNMAFGSDSRTTPSTSITSFLTFLTRSVLFFRSFPCALAAFFPNNAVVLLDEDGVDVVSTTTFKRGDVKQRCAGKGIVKAVVVPQNIIVHRDRIANSLDSVILVKLVNRGQKMVEESSSPVDKRRRLTFCRGGRAFFELVEKMRHGRRDRIYRA
jgi:hypothetical protein